MRVGIIGLGRAGRIHLEAWQGVGGAEVTAVCDRSAAVRRWARAAGFNAYTDIFDMIRRAPLDAVNLCTPPAHHTPAAIACLERGLHVLCEKPLALNTRAAVEMLRAAARHRRYLLLATKFRHVPDLARARELLAMGEIGEPVAFEIDFSSRVDMSRRWNARRAIAGGGVIIDNGCHAFGILNYLFGTLIRVLAVRLRPVQKVPVEDSATLLVAAGPSVIGRVEVSWSLTTAREVYVSIYGSRGTIQVGWHRSELRVNGHPPREIGDGYDKAAAHRRMMEAFRDVVAGRRLPWITSGECLRTVAAVDAAYRSLRSGGWERVETVPMAVEGPRIGAHEVSA
jgi:predicted dehydrogenase